MSALREEWLVRTARANAVVAWVVVAVLVALVGVSWLVGEPVAAALAGIVTFVVSVPAAVARSWRRMPPWPLAGLAALPVVVAPVAPGFVGDALAAAGVATLALLVVVDLQLLTTVRMTAGFAVAFVVISALGVAGFWAVGRWLASLYLGAPFVETNDDLMYEFLVVAGASVMAGLAFRWYLGRARRRQRAEVGGP